MGTPQDASTLNGQTLDAKYFYAVGSSAVNSSGTNGTNTYSGSVSVSGPASISGLVTNTSSNGNGSFSVTAANGTVTNYLVLGSSSDAQNLVIQAYNPTTGATGSTFVIADSGTQPTSSISFNSANAYLSPTCFLTGTMILTARGEVAVEELRAGDRLVTADGDVQPIRWVGRRSYDCRRYIKPDEVLPIRIAEGAVAPGVPSRDTFLSRGHAVAFEDEGGIAISAHELVNGVTIVRVEADIVTYWHIALDRHDVILANGLPVESYRDCGSGSLYETVDGAVVANTDDVGHRFRRVLFDAAVQGVRERLARRAHGLTIVSGIAA